MRPRNVFVGARPARAGEIERREHLGEERAALAHRAGGALLFQHRQRLRRELRHLVRAGLGRDDLRPAEQRVAVRVIAVGVRVDELADIVRLQASRVAHGREHIRRQRFVEQRIDQQRGVTIDDQPRVRPAPAAVRLQIRVEPRADIDEAFFERCGFHRNAPRTAGLQTGKRFRMKRRGGSCNAGPVWRPALGCPRQAEIIFDAGDPADDVAMRREIEPAFRRPARVGDERDVGDAERARPRSTPVLQAQRPCRPAPPNPW